MLKDVVATIMKKIKINDYCSLFIPVKSTTGHYNEELNVFYEADGSAYFDISSVYGSTSEYAFDSLIEQDKLMDDYYVPDFTFSDTLAAYADECSDFIVLAVRDKANDSVSTIYIDTKQVLDTVSEYGIDVLNDQFTVLTALGQSYQYCDNFDMKLDEICDTTLAGGLSNEKLERYKRILNHYLNRIMDVSLILEQEMEFNNSLEKSSDSTVTTDDDFMSDDIDVKKIYDYITGNVVGQDDAVYRFVIEVARAFDSGREKDGILITGESGVGKTLALTSLAECLNRPILIVDSTQLTMPGYVGKSIEEYLYDLYVQTGCNISLTENAIVFFDEIDKKGSSMKSDVAGQGVLNVLLKFLDGTTYDATDCKNLPSKIVKISTSNMLIIAGGAFRDVYGNKKTQTMGFENNKSDCNEEPSIDDFINKGMMTKEFMSRFPIVIHFKDLDKEDLLNVLKSSNKSPLRREEKTFENAGARLHVTPAYLDAVATAALKLKTGARGLKRIVSDTTWRPYADVKTCDDYDEVVLDADTVSNNKVYQLKTKDKF
jgi:ATP-dependent Clp protease ATP-binding subunit ClpX